MATYDYVLKVTDSSTGTVTLTSDPFDILEYHPRTASIDDPTVAETVSVRVRDSSVANNLDEFRTLSRLLRLAKEAQENRSVAKVYVTFKENASASEYRSELVEARPEWDENVLKYGYWTGDTQFANIHWERANWWEGPEAQVALTNPNGTANTSGLLVTSGNDGSACGTAVTGGGNRYNYVQIAGTSVTGDLPGATRLEITNNYTVNRLGYVFIGQNWTDTGFDHYYETSESSGAGTSTTQTGGSAIADTAESSAGGYRRFALVSGTETDLFNWALGTATMDDANGRYFKMLIAYSGAENTNVRFRVRIQWNSTTLWDSGLSSLDSNRSSYLRDICTFRLPPWLPGLTSLDGVNLLLRGYQATGSSVNIDLDYIVLMPTDGWRYLDMIGYGVANGSRIVDDGIDSRLYRDNGSGANRVGIFVGYGSPIKLRPNTTQRLYFQFLADATNSAYVNRSATVKLYYRPRRLSL